MIATSMTSNNPVVFVVDDDARVRDALSSLLAPAGHEVGGLRKSANPHSRRGGVKSVPTRDDPRSAVVDAPFTMAQKVGATL